MSKHLQAIRGMNDVLPETAPLWQGVADCWRDLMDCYGYQEIQTPVLEMTDLFKRSIGEVTDVVEKEMYSFEDRNGDSLSLRPEGTASCVRAAIEHGLLYNQSQKLWYFEPMFRHERPQKGRYRQFYQFGVEAMGFEGPDVDAEIVALTARFWRNLGVDKALTLQINTLGTPECRRQYREKLVAYYQKHQTELDEDSTRRLQSNPLRILDSKNPAMQNLNENAPKLLDHLSAESKRIFEKFCGLLESLNIAYEINPRLVRGLDYYSHTVFEWVTDQLGAQGTVCAGGRYDGLVEQLGGKPTPGTGFALGIERLLLLLEATGNVESAQRLAQPDVYLILLGEGAQTAGLALAESLRSSVPQLRVSMHCGVASMKSQFKKADKSGASLALVLGEEELANQQVAVKWLREDQPQKSVGLSELPSFLQSIK